MASLVLSDLLKTLKSTFGINKATFDAGGLTAARTFTLPDAAGTVKLQNKAEEAAAKLYALRTLR